LRRLLATHRYIVSIAVLGTFVAASALVIYEAIVLGLALTDIVREGMVSPRLSKILAIGLIDVFLIAIVMFIISLSLYALFVDETLPR